MDTGFEIAIDDLPSKDPLRIRGVGELDIAAAPRLESALARCVAGSPPSRAILVDLTGVTFIDSTGLGILIRAHERLGDRLRLDASDACRRLLRLTGLESRLLSGNGNSADADH